MQRSSTVKGTIASIPKEINRNFFRKVIIEHFKDFIVVSHEK